MKIIFYILFFCVSLLSVESKDVLKVYNRVLDKEYRFANEFLLDITAEKAIVNIRTIKGNTLVLHLEQIVKNQDANEAKKELEYLHFVERKERQRLYLHNYVQLPNGTAGMTSIVNNIYTIDVPENCHLKIKNELGNVTVIGVRTSSRFDLNYCELKLTDVKGKVYVDSRVGDVRLNDCEVEGEFITENVSMKLQYCKGSFDFTSKFGQISCIMSEQISLLNAEIEQCDITLINRTALDFDYVINVENAKINVLDEVLKDKVEMDLSKMWLHKKSEQAVGTVIIKSEYGDVSLY